MWKVLVSWLHCRLWLLKRSANTIVVSIVLCISLLWEVRSVRCSHSISMNIEFINNNMNWMCTPGYLSISLSLSLCVCRFRVCIVYEAFRIEFQFLEWNRANTHIIHARNLNRILLGSHNDNVCALHNSTMHYISNSAKFLLLFYIFFWVSENVSFQFSWNTFILFSFHSHQNGWFISSIFFRSFTSLGAILKQTCLLAPSKTPCVCTTPLLLLFLSTHSVCILIRVGICSKWQHRKQLCGTIKYVFLLKQIRLRLQLDNLLQP